MRAEAWHIPPWELFEEQTSRWFWLECAELLDGARNAVSDAKRRQAEQETN